MGVADPSIEEDDTEEPQRCPECGLVVEQGDDHRCPLATDERSDEQLDEELTLSPTPPSSTDG